MRWFLPQNFAFSFRFVHENVAHISGEVFQIEAFRLALAEPFACKSVLELDAAITKRQQLVAPTASSTRSTTS